MFQSVAIFLSEFINFPNRQMKCLFLYISSAITMVDRTHERSDLKIKFSEIRCIAHETSGNYPRATMQIVETAMSFVNASHATAASRTGGIKRAIIGVRIAATSYLHNVHSKACLAASCIVEGVQRAMTERKP